MQSREDDEEDFEGESEEESYVETLGRLMEWDKEKQNKNKNICKSQNETPLSSS